MWSRRSTLFPICSYFEAKRAGRRTINLGAGLQPSGPDWSGLKVRLVVSDVVHPGMLPVAVELVPLLTLWVRQFSEFFSFSR
jgi:hypothetical protein